MELKRTWKGTDPADRFYIDGKRVSRKEYDFANTKARMYGKQDCFWGRTRNRYGRREAGHICRVGS